jgi:predicted acetyltransferase
VTYDFRTAEAKEWDNLSHFSFEGFNQAFDQAIADVDGELWEHERTHLAIQDDAIAGAVAAFTRRLSVPGGEVPAAHVTGVSVGATHRRQGLLTRLLGNLHSQALELGEPVAVLWASEGRIYQRYGYALAARFTTTAGATNELTLVDPSTDRVRPIADVSGARDAFDAVFERVRRDRPGLSSRSDPWWSYVLADTPSHRDGAGPLRAVVHDGPDGIDGYLLFRIKNEWTSSGPNGTVDVRELMATTAEAYRALVRFALSVDLTRTVAFARGAVDEPLQFLVSDPRQLKLRLSDGLWVRLLDVPGALAARRYAIDIDVVIEVTDAGMPANSGRWRLTGSRDGATCTRTGDPADLACDESALAAAYLGGASLTALSAGGRVRELRPGALPTASTAFRWDREPAPAEVF